MLIKQSRNKRTELPFDIIGTSLIKEATTIFLRRFCSRSCLCHNSSQRMSNILATTVTAATSRPISVILAPSISFSFGSWRMAGGKHSSDGSVANVCPPIIKGMILLVLPIDMNVSTCLLTHSDFAERGEQITMRYLDYSRAWCICSGRLPRDSSEVSLNTVLMSRVEDLSV